MIQTVTIQVYFRRCYMVSSEHNGAWSHHQADFKQGSIFILFFLNISTNQFHNFTNTFFCDVITSLCVKSYTLRWLNTVLAVCEYMSFAKSWQEKGCSSQAETWRVKKILMKDFDWQVKCDVFVVSMATWTIEYNLKISLLLSLNKIRKIRLFNFHFKVLIMWGGASVRREICVSKSFGLALFLEGNLTFFFVLRCISGQFPSTSPRGG